MPKMLEDAMAAERLSAQMSSLADPDQPIPVVYGRHTVIQWQGIVTQVIG